MTSAPSHREIAAEALESCREPAFALGQHVAPDARVLFTDGLRCSCCGGRLARRRVFGNGIGRGSVSIGHARSCDSSDKPSASRLL